MSDNIEFSDEECEDYSHAEIAGVVGGTPDDTGRSTGDRPTEAMTCEGGAVPPRP